MTVKNLNRPRIWRTIDGEAIGTVTYNARGLMKFTPIDGSPESNNALMQAGVGAFLDHIADLARPAVRFVIDNADAIGEGK